MAPKKSKTLKSKVVNLSQRWGKVFSGRGPQGEQVESPSMPHWDPRAPKVPCDATTSGDSDERPIREGGLKTAVEEVADEETERQHDELTDDDAEQSRDYQPSTILRIFLEKHGANAQDHLDWRERPPAEPMRCEECQASAGPSVLGQATLFQCDDHLHARRLCSGCMLQTHRGTPFHCVRQWDIERRLWSKVALPQLGYVEHLGHDGAECPTTRAQDSARKMVIVHEHGITDMPVRFCQCGGALEEPYQLLQANLWPATWISPHTAIIIGALRAYEGLTHDANVNVHDYMKHLTHMTNMTLPHEVKDRYREFNMSARQYSHVRQCRRFGLRIGEVKSAAEKSGEMCVLCPACPQPGINMRAGWQLRDEDYKFLDALVYSIDGNYHLNLKDNKGDPADEGLSEGRGYFANTKDLKTFLAKAPKIQPKKSSCNEFAAMGSGKYKGKVSGVVAITCKHMMMLPGGIVDLLKAEEFRYVDFALVSCLQRYLQLLLLMGYYDIHCQYIKNLRERLEKEFGVVLSELDTITNADLPEIVAGVGKYHLAMHKGDCRHKHSLHYLPGAGMADGEMLERIWAVTNAIARRTKEMTAGHRHDVLNEHYSALNVRKVHAMSKDLAQKLKRAEKHLKSTTEYLEVVEKNIDKRTLKDWRAEHKEWCAKVVDLTQHRTLDDPFEPSKEAELTTKQIADHLKDEQLRKKDRGGVGLVGYVQEVLDIKDMCSDLLERLSDGGDIAEEQRTGFAQEVASVLKRVKVAEANHDVYLKPAVDAACDAQDGEEVPPHFPSRDLSEELPRARNQGTSRKRKRDSPAAAALAEMRETIAEISLPLPSDYHALIRDHASMREPVNVELKLRQGQAQEALDSLKTHLTTYHSLNARKRNLSGVIANTAQDRRVKGKIEAINKAKVRYREQYALLRLLGLSEVHDHFKPLADEDCKPFVILSCERKAGDSGRLPTWIWGDSKHIARHPEGAIKDFMKHCLKAHWFRHSALKTRWWEERLYCREEMYRTARLRTRVGKLGVLKYYVTTLGGDFLRT